MRILVTGWRSQIARALMERAPSHPEVSALSVGQPALDLNRPAAVRDAMLDRAPDVIVNAAGWTRVDDAEEDSDAAFARNSEGAAELARVAADRGVPVIHLSSVYVFDGAKPAPYVEDDAPAPLNAYGRSRLAGEQAIARNNPRHVILRTGWIYSEHGGNFVCRMLERARAGGPIDVVDDQVGSPTWTRDLAAAILDVAARLVRDGDAAPWGTYHAAGAGEASWHGLAERLFAVSAGLGGPSASLNPVTAEAFGTAAPRPANARLDCTRLRDAFGLALPAWQDSVAACVGRIVAAGDRQ